MGKPREEYETDTPEEFLSRCEALIRAIYYCYKDSVEDGGTDHYSLKTYVDSLIYNSLKAEEKITEKSANIPRERPAVHGNSAESCAKMKEAYDTFYYEMRSAAKKRIGYEDAEG